MIEGDKKIRHGLSARRDPTSYQITADIIIPEGTILRHAGGDRYTAPIGFGNTFGEFSITIRQGMGVPAGTFKRVVA